MSEPKHPYELFGIECGEGWKSLYQPIIDYITKYNEEHNPESCIYIDQIKEKFAGLRIYCSYYNVSKECCDKLEHMIHEAEKESYNICERCGTREQVGLVKGVGWYYTFCFDCLQKIAATNDFNYTIQLDDGIYQVNKKGVKEIS